MGRVGTCMAAVASDLAKQTCCCSPCVHLRALQKQKYTPLRQEQQCTKPPPTFSAYSSTEPSGNLKRFCTTLVSSRMRRPFTPAARQWGSTAALRGWVCLKRQPLPASGAAANIAAAAPHPARKQQCSAACGGACSTTDGAQSSGWCAVHAVPTHPARSGCGWRG